MKNILSLFSILLLSSVLTSINFIACSGQMSENTKLPAEIVLDGTFSAIDDKREIMINDNENFQKLMNEIYKNLDQMPRIPVVDFTKYSVVGVFIGPRNNGGFMVAIDSVTEGSNSISVNVTETAPGPNCVVTEALTKPFSLVKIPKTDKKPVFKSKQIVKDCQ